jgi:hypothetical protein
MARIRTIKPEFFRHEGLQDLEIRHPDLHPMLVFAGLFGHCDKQGVFEWKPRVLKLDILPFLDFEIAETLEALLAAGQLQRFDADGKTYGFIPSFTEHQSIGGKEAQAPAKYPGRNGEKTGKERGSNREATGTAGKEGKGREGNGREPVRPVDNSASTGGGCEPGTEDFLGKNSPPEEPQSRGSGPSDRRNGGFEAINDSVSKLLASGAYKVHEAKGIARALHVSELQVETAIRQLRDRGRLPTAVAAA